MKNCFSLKEFALKRKELVAYSLVESGKKDISADS